MLQKLEGTFKWIGLIVSLMVLILFGVLIYDKCFHKDPEVDKVIYQHKFDSLSFEISGLRSMDTILDNKVNSLTLRIFERDSLGKLNDLKTTNEIIKLKNSSNSIILAIGDSIIRSKQKR